MTQSGKALRRLRKVTRRKAKVLGLSVWKYTCYKKALTSVTQPKQVTKRFLLSSISNKNRAHLFKTLGEKLDKTKVCTFRLTKEQKTQGPFFVLPRSEVKIDRSFYNRDPQRLGLATYTKILARAPPRPRIIYVDYYVLKDALVVREPPGRFIGFFARVRVRWTLRPRAELNIWQIIDGVFCLPRAAEISLRLAHALWRSKQKRTELNHRTRVLRDIFNELHLNNRTQPDLNYILFLLSQLNRPVYLDNTDWYYNRYT
jgi:hypothetical protein